MSAGKVHARDSVLVAVAGMAWGFASWEPVAACAFAAGALAGVPISPDLDQETRTISENIIIRRSKVLGWAWFTFWYPYAKLIPHRSALSHWPILGTLGRLAYLGVPFLVMNWWPPMPIRLVVWAAGGLMISDAVHWFRDELSIRELLNGATK